MPSFISTPVTGPPGPPGAAGSPGANGAAGSPGSGFVHRGTYDSTATYAVNDIATFNGTAYRKTVAGTAAPTHVGTASWSSDTGAPTIIYPAGTAAGDVAILELTSSTGVVIAVTPSGFTLLKNQSSPGVQRWVYAKTLVTADLAGTSCAATPGIQVAGQSMVFRNVAMPTVIPDGTNVDNYGYAVQSAVADPAGALTTSLIVRYMHGRDQGGTVGNDTINAGTATNPTSNSALDRRVNTWSNAPGATPLPTITPRHSGSNSYAIKGAYELKMDINLATWVIFAAAGATGPAGSGGTPLINHLFATDPLSSYVADQATSLAGLVVTGEYLTSTDIADHSAHHTTAALGDGKAILCLERSTVSGVTNSYVYLLSKYVNDSNFVMMQFSPGDTNGVQCYLLVAGTYVNLGNLGFPSENLPLGEKLWMVIRHSENRVRFEVWQNDPRNGGVPYNSLNHALVAGAQANTFGKGKTGKPGFRLSNAYVGAFKIKELTAVSTPTQPELF